MNEIEFNLLLKTLRTSERALEKLYNFYYGKIIYHIGKKYGRTFAEDIAQDFFNSLLEKEKFGYVANPTTWVYLNCDSLAKRKVKYDSRYAYSDLNQIIAEVDVLTKEELYGDLYYAIKQLDKTEQEIVDLYYWEGYKLKEIAAILNLRYDAVRQRHKRIIKKLKKFFSSVTFTDSLCNYIMKNDI